MRNHLIFILLSMLTACAPIAEMENNRVEIPLTKEQKDYWYQGEAEITSYELTQARYGELRKGKAVMIYVTEPFDPDALVKSSVQDSNDYSVLKLNAVRKFETGIYPYSVMTSVFDPVQMNEHASKISFSAQEWCGHGYMELQNKINYDISIRSYFEGESEDKHVIKSWTEDELWTQLRINPDSIPRGEVQVIPSFFFLRMSHEDVMAYDCKIFINEINSDSSQLRLIYPELDREVTINFETQFPHRIGEWTEVHFSGFGESRKKMATTAKVIKRLKIDYWNKNRVQDSLFRDSLGL